jgi:hypothetical protein
MLQQQMLQQQMLQQQMPQQQMPQQQMPQQQMPQQQMPQQQMNPMLMSFTSQAASSSTEGIMMDRAAGKSFGTYKMNGLVLKGSRSEYQGIVGTRGLKGVVNWMAPELIKGFRMGGFELAVLKDGELCAEVEELPRIGEKKIRKVPIKAGSVFTVGTGVLKIVDGKTQVIEPTDVITGVLNRSRCHAICVALLDPFSGKMFLLFFDPGSISETSHSVPSRSAIGGFKPLEHGVSKEGKRAILMVTPSRDPKNARIVFGTHDCGTAVEFTYNPKPAPASAPAPAPTPAPAQAVEVKECEICMAAPRRVRFKCGHCVCCEACSTKLNKCPNCRKKIEHHDNRQELPAHLMTYCADRR